MLEVRNVSKRYGDTVILEQSNYIFPQTGIVCLMGASGGGKTTLLNLLAGFDTDYAGEILAGGTAINSMSADKLCGYRKDNIGFVFQNYHLLPGYTVLENVLLACELTGESPETSRTKVKELLSRLGIAGKENQRAENLSGGQKQRVAIARALINNPQILFADEPTGALDHITSNEIMELLREVAQERLVVVITHDPKICEFADEIIHIKDTKIVAEHPVARNDVHTPLKISGFVKTSAFARAVKNFKVHIKRYIAVSIAISIGVLAFLFSLSFSNVMGQSISAFKEKNTAFNNGYIKGKDDGTILNLLNSDDRIENVYYQYKLGEVSLSTNDKTVTLPEKFPMPKTDDGVSYGVMPRHGKKEVALTPSIAKKFSANIEQLIGKKLALTYNDTLYVLTISGIYNAGYDDFFVSSDVEQQLYENLPKHGNYSISYDVKDFSDIVAVSNSLEQKGLNVENASAEVSALQNTFDSLNKLFAVISILILAIGLFICSVLLFKLQNARYHEVGLLSALGFNRQQITSLISAENMLLSALATAVNLGLLGCSMLISHIFSLPLVISGVQVCLSLVVTFAIVMLLSWTASYKLVRTEPAAALHK